MYAPGCVCVMSTCSVRGPAAVVTTAAAAVNAADTHSSLATTLSYAWREATTSG